MNTCACRFVPDVASRLTVGILSLLVVGLAGCATTGESLTGTSEPMKLAVRAADSAGPQIVITSPGRTRGLKLVKDDSTVVVRGTATDENGVESILVNGESAELDSDGGFSSAVRLRLGNNIITVAAYDTEGNRTTHTITIERSLPDFIEGKFYALLIGIDTYQGDWPALETASNDVRKIGEVLRSQYHFDDITLLQNEQATRENIIRRIEWLEENAKPEDNVLIYYAGHGDLRESRNRGYWVPVDATTRSTSRYISNADVQSYVRGFKAKHVLLVADACFSGDLFRGPAADKAAVTAEQIPALYGLPSRQVLTAGGIEPVLDGGRDGHSVFAYAFIRALSDNVNAFLDAGSLFDSVNEFVVRNAEQIPKLDYLQNTGDEGGQFIFVRTK